MSLTTAHRQIGLETSLAQLREAFEYDVERTCIHTVWKIDRHCAALRGVSALPVRSAASLQSVRRLCGLLHVESKQIRVAAHSFSRVLDCRLFSTHQLLREVLVDATNRVRILEMLVQDVHCRLNACRDWQ
jgi:hypothetical protein